MRYSRTLVLLALGAFALTLFTRVPARWIAPRLPAGILCTEPAGTVWSGSCARLEANGTVLGPARWLLRPSRLLTGRVAATLQLAPPESSLQGEFAWRLPGGALEGRDVRGTLVLQPGGVLPGVPPDLEGRVDFALKEVAWHKRAVAALRGVIEVRDLQQRSVEGRLPLGSYRLRFADPPDASGQWVGAIEDTGGPLDVKGRLALTPAPGYLLTGTVALRPGAPEGLSRQIAFLGSPDAEGRRPFAQEASF